MRKNALHLSGHEDQVSGKFGTALWRRQMILRVQNKMRQKKPLSDEENAFVVVELGRPDES